MILYNFHQSHPWVQVRCNKAGPAKEALELVSEPLPATLEWGEVLVRMQYAPINPADTYTARTGGLYGDSQSALPFIAGHDGVGVVTKVTVKTSGKASLKNLNAA